MNNKAAYRAFSKLRNIESDSLWCKKETSYIFHLSREITLSEHITTVTGHQPALHLPPDNLLLKHITCVLRAREREKDVNCCVPL